MTTKLPSGIEQLPSGNYRVRLQYAGTPIRETFSNLDEAVEMRDILRRQIADDESIPSVGLTLKDIGPRFLASRAKNRSHDDDVSRWNTHVASSRFSRKALTTVTRADCVEWLDDLEGKLTSYTEKQGERTAKPISFQTRKHCLNLVRSAFKWAIAKEHITANPTSGLKVEREDGDENEGYQEGWYLDGEEQARFLATWDEVEWPVADAPWRRAERLIAQFALGSALRIGELCCLHLADVHVGEDELEPHVIVRFGSWDPINERYLTPKGRKGTKKIRRVPLFGLALEAARAWLKVLPWYLEPTKKAARKPLGLMFPTERGSRREKPPRSWAKVVEKFGVVSRIGRDVWWHLLRHSAASSMVSGAWGHRWALEDVSKVLGHSSVKTTEIYAHLSPAAVQGTATRAQAAYAAPVATALPRREDSPSVAVVSGGLRSRRSEVRILCGAPAETPSIGDRGPNDRGNVVATLTAALEAQASGDPRRDALSVRAMGLALDVLLEDAELAKAGTS